MTEPGSSNRRTEQQYLMSFLIEQSWQSTAKILFESTAVTCHFSHHMCLKTCDISLKCLDIFPPCGFFGPCPNLWWWKIPFVWNVALMYGFKKGREICTFYIFALMTIGECRSKDRPVNRELSRKKLSGHKPVKTNTKKSQTVKVNI